MLISANPRSFLTALLAALLPLISQFAIAQQSEPAGAADHPLLERFAGSVVVEYEEERDVNYRLVLGNMRRAAGSVIAENSERFKGDLTRITYQVPQGFTAAEVAAFYQTQVSDSGYNVLFSCNGRECGNSNYWANEVFGKRSLYGPDRNQYYMALQMDSGSELQNYAVVYVITRANRRLFAHVEVLETKAMQGSFEGDLSAAALLQRGALRVDGVQFGVQDRLVSIGELDKIARLLQDNESIQLYVVSHLSSRGSSESTEALMSRSLRRAELVREQLIDRGVDGRRLVAQGVGPLAPLCGEDDCAERIELVVRLGD